MRIAVLGGGGVGVCAALEIARHGHFVDLYEQDPLPVRRASRINEGKIHQGFLYAKDAAHRTARTMIRGALAFTACLSRWIELREDTVHLSTPFVYAIHKDTMVDVDRLRGHFASCCTIAHEMRSVSGLKYLGRDEPWSFRDLERGEIERVLDPRFTTAAIVTSELSVDPRIIAERLSDGALSEPRITFIGGARVIDVARRTRGAGFDVTFDRDGVQKSGPYDHVVNALWEGRLAVDRRLGIEPSRPWIHRHKFGNRVRVRLAAEDLPSVTMVLGPFGDLVNFGPNGFYLSWYPIGMVATSLDLEPPREWQNIRPEIRREVFERSREHWLTLCPKLKDIAIEPSAVDATSGAIFAWGETDISDPDSKLHDRYQIGVHTVDRYHSVNTGKYTMVPYLGLKAAERVLGVEPEEFGLRD